MAEWRLKKGAKKARKEKPKGKETEKKPEDKKQKEEESFKISSVGLGEFGREAAESLESEVIGTSKEESKAEADEDFSGFIPASVHDIPVPVLASSVSGSAGNIEEQVGGINAREREIETEASRERRAEASRERREQAARTPAADYNAMNYQRNYWVGGEEKIRQPRDEEMGIIQPKPRRNITEMPEETRRVDFSAWQREMEESEMAGQRGRPAMEEEYVIDVSRKEEDTRLPFERKEEKRKYRP